MNINCLKCRKPTKDLNSKGFITKNKKYLLKSICNVCKSRKSKFVSKQQAEGFLSQLFSKIPILNKIIQNI